MCEYTHIRPGVKSGLGPTGAPVKKFPRNDLTRPVSVPVRCGLCPVGGRAHCAMHCGNMVNLTHPTGMSNYSFVIIQCVIVKHSALKLYPVVDTCLGPISDSFTNNHSITNIHEYMLIHVFGLTLC